MSEDSNAKRQHTEKDNWFAAPNWPDAQDLVFPPFVQQQDHLVQDDEWWEHLPASPLYKADIPASQTAVFMPDLPPSPQPQAIVGGATNEADLADGKFRLQKSHVLITWSCPTDRDDNPIDSADELLTHLKTLRNVAAAVVSKELHESGKTHFHAYLHFKPKLNTRDARFFDFKGVHPNIAPGKDDQVAMIKYVIKHGDYVAWNVDVAAITTPVPLKANARAAAYTEALEVAANGDIAAARVVLQKADPVNWCKSHMAIKSALDNAYQDGVASRNPINIMTTRWTPLVTDINLNKMDDGEDYHRTYVLVGDAGIGKTQAAKYLLAQAGCKNIICSRTAEGLRNTIDTCDGFVFDELNANSADVRGGRWTRESQINLVDRVEVGAIPARYSDIVLKPHVIRVITTNMLSRALDVNDPAIARRIKVIDFAESRLYE